MIKILLVEDEISLAEIIKDSLEHRGFSLHLATTSSGAIQTFYQQRPDILILDVMLPDGSGFMLAKQIRHVDQEVRIIFLTSKSLPADVVMGFNSGGNDYLKKPFHMEELIIRIKVLMSRNQVLLQDSDDQQDMTVGKFLFRPTQHLLVLQDKTYNLTAKETALLHLLVLNKHQAIERKVLLDHIWKDDSYFAGRSMDVFISKLRGYLSADPSIKILNIRGVGFKLIF